MTTDTVTSPQEHDTDHDLDELVHTVCCDPDRALCGEDMSDGEDSDVDMPDCVVCHDLYGKPCGAFLCRFRMQVRRWWPW